MDLASLSGLLLGAMSPNPLEIKRCEGMLNIAKKQPGFAVAILNLCSTTAPNTNLDVAKAAAILFKNFVKLNWNTALSQENDQTPDVQITEEEKRVIKQGIVDLMCSVHKSVQRQLSEGVRVIAAQDWPYAWEDLLPRLTSRLLDTNQPITVTIGVLSTMNELFKRFRDAPASDELHTELKIALEGCQAELLTFFKSILCPATFACTDPTQAELYYSAVRFCCRIFYSLNWQTIPEFFEDNARAWMEEFLKFLTLPQNPFPQYNDEENPSPLERVQTAIFENIGMYVAKYATEFQPFLSPFLQAAFTLLVQGSKSPFVRYDELVNSGMRFVSYVVLSPDNASLFAQEQTMRAIFEQIIIPNLAIRQTDIESFEDNPIEYLRRDIEGSDAETRRRIACDLIEKLCRNFDQAVTSLCVGYIEQLLQKHQANPQGEWLAKDAASTLVIAISVRASTQREGATKVKDVGTILQFLRTHVLPELNQQLIKTTSPILLADAIKYVAVFRQFIPKEEVLQQVLPLLVTALDAKSVVVHTYAAAAIDGLLSIREPQPPRDSRYKKHDIAGFAQPILIKLFTLIEAGGNNYNEYLMKCVVRVINVSREDVGPVVPQILAQLSGILARVASNPSNPIFNHFLFESIAALLKFGYESQKCTVEQLEAAVNPAFEFILQKYIVEFVPYVLQIMAQTLQMRKQGGIPPHFQTILPGIMSPVIWEHRANIPALVTLLEAYLIRGADQMLSSDEQIDQLFRIFDKLIKQKSTEDLSFELMRCVVSFCAFDRIQAKLTGMLQTSLMKYSQTKNPSLAQSLVTFIGVLMAKRGPAACAQCCESIQPGMFLKIVLQIMIPNLGKITDQYAKKAIAVGFTRLLCEFQQNLDEQTWSQICVAQVQFLEDRSASSNGNLPDESQLTRVNEALEQMAEAGHSTAFARLAFARDESANDMLSEIRDPQAYFMENLLNQGGLGHRAIGSLQDQRLVTIFKTWAKGRV